MSWPAIMALAAGCYALKAIGPLAIRAEMVPARAHRLLAMLAVAVLAALTAVQTLSNSKTLTLDARAAGVFVAAVLVVRRAPFLVVVLAAAATAAVLRLAT